MQVKVQIPKDVSLFTPLHQFDSSEASIGLNEPFTHLGFVPAKELQKTSVISKNKGCNMQTIPCNRTHNKQLRNPTAWDYGVF